MRSPVVYVHGFIGHMRFAELRDGLDAERVISPDLLGYGAHADFPWADLSIARQVAHLSATIQAAFGDEPVLLVAHSGGAPICVHYARAYPDRVAGFVSAEGNLSPSDAFLSSRLAPMTPGDVATWLDAARADPVTLMGRDRMPRTPVNIARVLDWLHNQSAQVIHAMARALLVETVQPGYATAVMEVLASTSTWLVEGERSERGLGVSPRLKAMAAGVVSMRGLGHMMVLENPSAFAAVIQDIADAAGASILEHAASPLEAPRPH